MRALVIARATEICHLWPRARQRVRLVAEWSARRRPSAMWRNVFQVHALSRLGGCVVWGGSGGGPNLALEIGGVALPCVSAESPTVKAALGRRCR